MPRRLFLAAALCLLLAGCSQDQRILERIGYIETAAFDAAPEDKLEATISMPLVTQFARDAKTTDELLETTATSPKEAKAALSLRTSRIIVSGQIRTFMFGEALARRGLWAHMDTFLRDPSISIRTAMVVVEGKAGEIISQEYPRHTKTANYINKLLQKEFNKQSVPRTALHQFTRDYFDDGMDPIAIMIKEQEKDITISGIATFQGDKMIDKLPWKDVYLFSLLYQNLSQGEFNLTSEDPDLKSISFRAVKSKRRIKILKGSSGEYEADIYLKVEGGVEEYIGNAKLSTPERTKVEKLISEQISTESLRVIKTLQQNHTDSFGMGKYVRNKMSYKEWKETDWHDLFSQMPVRVHCSFHMKQFGTYFD
ncbi:MAG: Ger(x)C family spore germination protein [Paenibacillaceae bacterium]|uniref:Ger(X)C family spore germination protein n=1 Tax=Paenibacillus mellifer TaxID=2937794 RepID=A0A9X1XUB3_9BACL|nr:Ger(x)C family spore germination protein [Paenibacillus mellifer]MBW4840078.1 Ger(x)C family spore germination protein [Paenibacillaceae bacterium]MCK8485715.1 Ger(x)C family spore germination protein [Paenibacillus mellifer]